MGDWAKAHCECTEDRTLHDIRDIENQPLGELTLLDIIDGMELETEKTFPLEYVTTTKCRRRHQKRKEQAHHSSALTFQRTSQAS